MDKEFENNNDTNSDTMDIETTVERQKRVAENRFKDAAARKTLQTRLISTVVLLVLLVAYVISGILYTEFSKGQKRIVDVAAGFSVACSAFVVGFATYEMNNAMGIKKWWQHLVIIISNLIIFLMPTVQTAYNFAGYHYLFTHVDLFAKHSIYLFLATFIGFDTVILLISAFYNKLGFKKAVINMMMQIVICFGFKGFTIIMLSLSSVDPTQSQYSWNTALWIWMMIIFGDSFAYLGGMRFGKTQLAPKTSPKKTWEGAAIGLSSAIVAGIVFAICCYYLASNYQPLRTPIANIKTSMGDVPAIAIYVMLAVAFPIIGLFGDLLFSVIKRYTGIKDYSNIIPGHGGLLDRLDSFAFSFFIVFLIVGFLS